jgi:hypothetical protein
MYGFNNFPLSLSLTSDLDEVVAELGLNDVS